MNVTSTQGMVDILPPAPPSFVLWTYFPVIAVLLLTLTVIVFIWLRREPRSTLKRLSTLLSQYQRGKIETQPAACILATELRQFFQLTHVATFFTPQGIDTTTWTGFVTRLQSIRFSQHGNTQETLSILIQQTQQWVAQHGR